MLEVPESVTPVSIELLEQLAAEAAETRRATATEATMKMFEFDMEAWMAKVGIVVEKCPSAYRGGRRWTLAACPFDNSHTGGSAAIFESKDGVLGFKCQHNDATARAGKMCAATSTRVCCPGAVAGERKQEDRDRRKEPPRSPGPRRRRMLSQAVESAINFTDLGNARLLVSHHGSDFRYCHESARSSCVWNSGSRR